MIARNEMSTAASNGKTATGGRLGAGSIDKPAKAGAKAPKAMTPEQRKHAIVVSVTLLVVLGVAAAMYAYFRRPAVDPNPRLNSNFDNLAQFVATNNFDKLEFDRKKLYWKELSGKKKELEQLFEEKKIDRKQAQEILSVMWIGKQFKHVEHYNSLGAIDRKDYLDKLIDDEISDPKKPKDALERDKPRVKTLEATFPSQDRQELEAFRKALSEREKQRKKEDRQIKRAAATAPARPTTRPATPSAKPAPTH